MITTPVPENNGLPGTFQVIDVTSGGSGLVALVRRGMLVGMMSAVGTATALLPVQVFDETSADTLFGAGSELALMCRASMAVAKKYGRQPQLWAQPIANSGTAATYTMTFAGTATAAGDFVFRIAGRTIRVPIAVGDLAAAVAANALAAIKPLYPILPVSAAAPAAVLTLTARSGGVNGNDIKVPLIDANVAGITCTAAAGVSGATAYDCTAALDVLSDKTYHGVAFANHDANTITDAKTWLATQALPGTKQWSVAYFAETGTLATAQGLATPANEMDVVVTSVEGGLNLPGEYAAAMLCFVEGSEYKRHFDDVELPLFPIPAASVPTATEKQSAIDYGVTPLTNNAAGDAVKIVRLVTTKTTDASSNPFNRVADIHVVRTMYEVCWQVDARWSRTVRNPDNPLPANEATAATVRSITLDVLYKMQDDGGLQNVKAHEGELIVEHDLVNLGRFNVAIPASVPPALHQLVGINKLILE
jgi:phage tail sheath gpL-like